MKIVIINKSDATGGAAVVSLRMMEALRSIGQDARMLVVEKRTDSEYVTQVTSHLRAQVPFLEERLRVYAANGRDRSLLFKVDPATDGLPIWRHQLVREADAVILNWVNQGMLSIGGVQRILQLRKPVLWVMHDMWNMTGICHHAGHCERYQGECGECPLLGSGAATDDLSHRVWKRKRALYDLASEYDNLTFIPVSNWLAERARKSSLMAGMPMQVIPNAYDSIPLEPKQREDGKIRIVIGAARLDDDVKGFPILIEATKALSSRYPELAERVELTTFGGIRDSSLLQKLAIPHRHIGFLKPSETARVYRNSDIVLSTSLYETLPTTLIEGASNGAIPVCTDRGGQRDIVTNLYTGYIANWDDDVRILGERIADGIAWAAERIESDPDIVDRMHRAIEERFSAKNIARRVLSLLQANS